MIANAQELQVAARHLVQWREAARLLEAEMQTSSPILWQATAVPYLRRIEELQTEIAAYLCEHPADIALILPPMPPALAT